MGEATTTAEVEEEAASGTSAEVDAKQAGLLDAQIEAIEHAFSEHEKSIASLREEIGAMGIRAPERDTSEIEKRITAIESKLDEQERSLRHVLSMMIDYFECDASRDAA